YALRPAGIEWPINEEGKVSFKLEMLSAANGLVHEAAHDALSDVRATIALARLIREKQPRLFDFCLALRKKDRVFDEINLANPKPFIHISGMYGVERGNLAIVWPLAMHPTNKNEIIVWDLAFDPSELFTLDAATMRERMFTKLADLPDGVTRLPIKTIHANKSPIVVSNLKTLSAEQAALWGVDMDVIHAHAAQLATGSDLSAIWRDVFKREASTEKTDVDANLYGGFVSPTDRRTLNRIRTLSPDKLAVEQAHFDDRQLEELFFRYRARNYPNSLNEQEMQRWEQWRSAKLFDGTAGSRTLEQYSEEIDRLSEDADERGEAILAALYDYAEIIAPEINY
ncbi:MAG: exodeoxyribonuclease I, partial [Deefgea sp.]